MWDIVIILVIKSKYISGNRVTYSYLEFKLQLDIDLIYVRDFWFWGVKLVRDFWFGGVKCPHSFIYFF